MRKRLVKYFKFGVFAVCKFNFPTSVVNLLIAPPCGYVKYTFTWRTQLAQKLPQIITLDEHYTSIYRLAKTY